MLVCKKLFLDSNCEVSDATYLGIMLGLGAH